MCGIWLYLDLTRASKRSSQRHAAFEKIAHRGPDCLTFKRFTRFEYPIEIGFARLSIMCLESDADQPMVAVLRNQDTMSLKSTQSKQSKQSKPLQTYVCICNGEIYNYRQLIIDHSLDVTSDSDCAVIPALCVKYGFDRMISLIKGEFALIVVIHDHETGSTIIRAARDRFGVRPLFLGKDNQGYCLASEMKALTGIVDPKSIKPFKPGTASIFNPQTKTIKSYYFNTFQPRQVSSDFDQLLAQLHDRFKRAVVAKLKADCPMGFMLSGGLDSSSCVAFAVEDYIKLYGEKPKTFSVGMQGSTDKYYAELVAAHCGTDHTHFEISVDESLEAISDVVYHLESFDVTTVRASTPSYLLAKKIKTLGISCLINGDGADEVMGGYIYFHKAPSGIAFDEECWRLLDDIYLYDGLRPDRTLAAASIEARFPFLDPDFVYFFMSIAASLRMPHSRNYIPSEDSSLDNGVKIEKWLFRTMIDRFRRQDGKKYLPDEVLWRQKEAFSDGISSVKDSWYSTIQKHMRKLYEADDIKTAAKEYSHCSPETAEALEYRVLFEKRYPQQNQVIPYIWMPKWCQASDPSARVLTHYEELHDDT